MVILFDIYQTIYKELWYTFYTIQPKIKRITEAKQKKKKKGEGFHACESQHLQFAYRQAEEGTQIQNFVS